MKARGIHAHHHSRCIHAALPFPAPQTTRPRSTTRQIKSSKKKKLQYSKTDKEIIKYPSDIWAPSTALNSQSRHSTADSAAPLVYKSSSSCYPFFALSSPHHQRRFSPSRPAPAVSPSPETTMRTRSGSLYSPCGGREPAPPAVGQKRKRSPAQSAAAADGESHGRRKRQAPGLDYLDELPDDLVLSILSKLAASASSPSDLLSVHLTYAPRCFYFNQSSTALSRRISPLLPRIATAALRCSNGRLRGG